MLAKFRRKYPQGSLLSELVKIDRGTYIVKALVQVEQIVLATALASGATVEAAEDAAKERAIASLFPDDVANSPTLPAAQVETLTNATDSSPTAQIAPANPPSNHQIVNFSKPQSQPVAAVADPSSMPIEQNKQSQSVAEAQPTVGDTPIQQLNLDNVPAADSPEQSTNLFGDAFNAPNPTIDPPALPRADSASQSVDGSELKAMDFNEIKQKTDIEIRRLGWTKEQGRDFLMSRYGKRSRLHLKDEQLIEFLHYLENLPNPVK